MPRIRTFTFRIKSQDIESVWLYLCTIEPAVEYMCMNIIRKTINGFIRFKQPKSLYNVEELLQTKSEIIYEYRPDSQVRELIFRKDNFYECGKLNSKKTIKNDKPVGDLFIQSKSDIVNFMTDCVIECKKQLSNMCIETINNVNSTANACITNNNANTNITNNNANVTNNNANTNITNNNVTVNNKVSFNLNMFLNDKCKDAMDIDTFMKSIPIGLDEVMLFNRLSHADAITRIIDKAYKDVELTMRPLHCTDLKRETLYIKSDNKWTNDESKAIIEQAIDTVANRSFGNLKIWKEANPDFNEDEDKKTQYARIMRQMLGGLSDREIEENKSKIVRNVARMAQLDKEEAKLI